MNLDIYLRDTGTTAAEFAERLEISEASLSRIRRGDQNISRDLIRLIVEQSDGAVTADDLVFNSHVQLDAPAASVSQ